MTFRDFGDILFMRYRPFWALGPVVISAITTVSLFLSNRQCFFTPSGCSRLAFPAAAAAQFKKYN
ncbi:MAG: hypothetical protein WC202_14060, partial [Desulfobacterales bacterium]